MSGLQASGRGFRAGDCIKFKIVFRDRVKVWFLNRLQKENQANL